MTWRTEARGLPVWPGAKVYEDDGTAWIVGIVYDLADTDAMQDNAGFGQDAPWPKGTMQVAVTAPYENEPTVLIEHGQVFEQEEVTPALDNPDVFAAFLRRLAIRLGCPEDVAAGGVLASITDAYGPPHLSLGAGWGAHPMGNSWEWRWMKEIDTGDRLLAAVRAWKGVGGG